MDGLSWKPLFKWMIWGYPYFWKHPYVLYVHQEKNKLIQTQRIYIIVFTYIYIVCKGWILSRWDFGCLKNGCINYCILRVPMLAFGLDLNNRQPLCFKTQQISSICLSSKYLKFRGVEDFPVCCMPTNYKSLCTC